ncbi:unnamed protein product [Ectocarpus sp. 4 AP-2014]
MTTRRRGPALAVCAASLLSSTCLAFAPAAHQLRAVRPVSPSGSTTACGASLNQEVQQPNRPRNRRSLRIPSRQRSRRDGRRRLGELETRGGEAVVALAAETAGTGGGGEGESGVTVEASKGGELTQEEKEDEINKLVYVTEALSSSKMMTIDSFGPEQSASARRGKKSKTNNASTQSYSTAEPMLPEAIARQKRLYEKRKWRLIGDNFFLGLLGTAGAWGFSLKAACSYGLGATLGTAYLVLLSRFVENFGNENADGGGGGGGPARLALAGLLVLIVSKNKDTFEFIPAVSGFLAYQIATLVQGIYTDFDELEDAAAETAAPR